MYQFRRLTHFWPALSKRFSAPNGPLSAKVAPRLETSVSSSVRSLELKTMHRIFQTNSFKVPMTSVWAINGMGRLRSIALGALATLVCLSNQVSAQATIKLSPLVAKSQAISAADPGKEINVVFALPLKNGKGAAEFIQHVSTPGDPLYHRYLSPEQFATRFGGDEADYAALKAWTSTNGLKISQESVARTALTVRGTIAQFQAIFKTQLNNYRSPSGDEFYSASINPTVPDAISTRISGVIGLTDSRQYAPLVKVGKTLGETPDKFSPDTAGGTGPGGTYCPKDLRTCYGIPAFGNLSPQTVAVFEQGGFYASDVETFLKRNSLPKPPVTFVSVNGWNGTVNDTNVELEAVLDIDMVIGTNPAVKQVLVYEDGNDTFPVALLDALQQVAADNKAQVLSISYGQDEVLQGNSAMAAEATVFTQLAGQGITVCVSSGDGGAYGDTGTLSNPAQLNVEDPGSQPYVTSVGGTTLYTGPELQWENEEVWNLEVSGGATGGGVSNYWAIPTYQPVSVVTKNGGSATMRNVPDVAAVANPNTGVGVYSKVNGGWVQIGGTSVSAPLWAGYLSVINSAYQFNKLGQIGFFNSAYYTLVADLYDVWDGDNGNVEVYGTPGYTAGYGYDDCTGNGTIFGGLFAFAALESAASPSGTYKALNGLTAKGLAKQDAELVWQGWDEATGYIISLNPLDDLGNLTNVAPTFFTTKTNYKLSGLTPGTEYLVYVAGIGPNGCATSFVTFFTK
jgi:subtilase family serine protease